MAADKKKRGSEEPEDRKSSGPRGRKNFNDDGDHEPTTVFDLSSHETDEDSADDVESEPVAVEEEAVVEEPEVPETDLDAPDEELTLSDEDTALLDQAAADIVAEMRSDMLRAQAELVNFRTRVERDRLANRESVIAEVIRSLLPAIDDLSRAEKHGDLEGSPLALVANKLRATFERYGVREVGVSGEPFDPSLHEAVIQIPTADVTVNTVADVLETGYALGERLIRAAKVTVSVPD